MSQQNTNEHYDAVAAGYENAWFYKTDSDYHKWLLDQVVQRLCVQPGERVIDFGGGDGAFTQCLHRTYEGSAASTVCVDPSRGMLDKAQEKSGLEVLLGDETTFTESESLRYDKMLLKEVIHHIDTRNLSKFLSAVSSQISPDVGVLLSITRMPSADHYPFFPLAEKVWAENSGRSHADYVTLLEEAGFTVTMEVLDYQVVIDQAVWFGMIRNRFWSTFSAMSDSEIEEGLLHLQSRLEDGAFGYNASDRTLSFPDKFSFISATVKPKAKTFSKALQSPTPRRMPSKYQRTQSKL